MNFTRAQFLTRQLGLGDNELLRVTTLLKARPGPKGWGSLRTFLQQHGLAAQEGE